MRARSSLLMIILTLGLVAVAAPGRSENVPEADEGPPPRPALPEITELRVEPASLVLENGRDIRRVLISGRTAAGEWIDLTDLATIEPESDSIDVDDEGYVYPIEVGAGEVTAYAAGLSISAPVEVKSIDHPPVRFTRDIMPVMTRAGCNAGTCHGNQKGKNGFKLSLRGYDPAFDYSALVEDLSGRRFNRASPENSLMLLKPSAEAPHEGGEVLPLGSRGYELIKTWINEGVAFDDVASGRVESIEVLPKDADISLPGMTQQLIVVASYADGSERDVTRQAMFTSSDTNVAEISEAGSVVAVRRGEAAMLVRYEGAYATREVAVMGERDGFEWAAPEEANFIDPFVNAKLQRMKILPSGLATDAEFLRRVHMDLIGIPAQPEAVRAFIDDPAPRAEKRERVIDELLASDDFVEHWTNKWADLLQCSSKYLGDKGVRLFRKWIRDSLEENLPYDQFVRELVTAQGSTYSNPPANYLRVLGEPNKATEDVSQVFLGVRFQCAKCHDHPFEAWTQNQYYEFGAYFSRLGLKGGQRPGEQIVYTKYDDSEVEYPGTGKTVSPSTPFGESPDLAGSQRQREAFADWLTSEDNPLFATAMVNRVWSYFMGRGIIEPVDDIRDSNPATNPELLDALSEHFIEGGFNVKETMRAICMSNTYQRSVRTNEWNEDDSINFSHAAARRLSAEQMLDAISMATGTEIKFEGLPAGLRAAEAPDGVVKGNEFLKLFGRPKRESACECERTDNVSLSHALNLINGPTIGNALVAKNGRLSKLIESSDDDAYVIEEIYLAVLGRLPSATENKAIDLASAPTRLEGAQDLAWALLNSPAFLFNR